ncbi:hypothetical protein BOTBODRAFT_639736 [Botryobasidium botryosum FD-172 SS1]|uniref:RING-type domain-containing protein n=1 Tax=Botryobasidium botryosum (strain FD-172 SS1) TaxID=930990 RepID=A0A067MGJ8_BOTB1|nr:hypothetical protein BOTBODRAFT_639736 [Botryobasidium botryosum FD-172 SS1]
MTSPLQSISPKMHTPPGPVFPVSRPQILAPTLPITSPSTSSPLAAYSPGSPGTGSTDGCSESSTQQSVDWGTFTQNMKIHINEPIGNLTISPAGRDVCLAARKGLFIIDLDKPHETPRFLPQGGTWEVADVQWNPHPSNSHLVTSTSSQKLLVWNLYQSGSSAIQHILHAHYRAITDINWHAHAPDLVASCGIDSWIWVWDLRAGKRMNVMGFSAWNAGATQVKWNRRDEHLLASSHEGVVHIWDDRKGSLPLTSINAHDSKIYGIDWSRVKRNEIVTCSLDTTIKFWEIDMLSRLPEVSLGDDTHRTAEATYKPVAEIHTSYPVWRARHLPFGHGVLSLPHRGENYLELWRRDQPKTPVERIIGHEDVVKEYVWRTRGGLNNDFDDREFQLVTWSKDRTLRLWPIDQSTLEKTGFIPGLPIAAYMPRRGAAYQTFHTPPPCEVHPAAPKLTAPHTNRGVLAGVRAGIKAHTRQASSARSPFHAALPELTLSESPIATKAEKPSARMTVGHTGGKQNRGGINHVTWLSSVQVEQRDGSGSGGDSNSLRRFSVSRSRTGSFEAASRSRSKPMRPRQSLSRSRGSFMIDDDSDGEVFEPDLPQTLAEEVTSVARAKEIAAKVKFEKVDVSTKRKCTFSMRGPWGKSVTPAFIRITFKFPKDYPKGPASMPTIDLEKNDDIGLRTRAFMLRNLRNIREQRRPCLESCLRFLLGLPDVEGLYRTLVLSDSESDEITSMYRENGVVSLPNQNVPRPRLSQGVFGPNGQLVCFFSVLVSKTHRYRPNPSPTPSTTSKSNGNSKSMLFAHSGALSDALRGLTQLSNQHITIPRTPSDRTKDLIRFMDVIPRPSISIRSRTRDSIRSWDTGDRTIPRRSHSALSIKDFSELLSVDEVLAHHYSIACADPASLCLENAAIARSHSRPDHECFWALLHALVVPTAVERRSGGLPSMKTGAADSPNRAVLWGSHPLAGQVIAEFYKEFALRKDVQMLAMMSLVLFEADRLMQKNRPVPKRRRPRGTQAQTPMSARPGSDYFGVRSQADMPSSSTTSIWPRIASFLNLHQPVRSQSVSQATSSPKSSWISMFSSSIFSSKGTAAGGGDRTSRPDGGLGLAREASRVSVRLTQPPPEKGLGLSLNTPLQRSFSDPSHALSAPNLPPTPNTRTSRVVETKRGVKKKTSVSFYGSTQEEEKSNFFTPLIDDNLRPHYEDHIRAYAEMLCQWELFIKRAEILKCIPGKRSSRPTTRTVDLEIIPKCARCHRDVKSTVDPTCPTCRRRTRKARCTICRLPTTGLEHVCLRCCHISHYACWTKWDKSLTCPTGCGCDCSGTCFEVNASSVPPSPALFSPVESERVVRG